MMPTTKKINANGTEISILLQGNENDYICLTDMARYKDKQRTDYIIQNWMRSRSTIEYLGVWEQLHNPNFNPIEFDGFRNHAGLHSFSLTPNDTRGSLCVKKHDQLRSNLLIFDLMVVFSLFFCYFA